MCTPLSEDFIDLMNLEDNEGNEEQEQPTEDALALCPSVWEDESLPMIVRFGISEYRRQREMMGKSDEPEELLTEEQTRYLELLSCGASHQEACMELGIDRIIPTIWGKMRGKDSVYGLCIQAIKDTQADDLEDTVWKEAIENPRNTDIKKFALKARKEEYKDNVLPQTNVQTNIRVTFDGVPYNVDVRAEE